MVNSRFTPRSLDFGLKKKKKGNCSCNEKSISVPCFAKRGFATLCAMEAANMMYYFRQVT